MLLSVRWVTWPIVIQGENKIWGLKQGFPYTLASPSFPLPTLSPCPTSRKLGQLVIHLISLTVACWLCHQAVHLLEQSLFFIILVKRKQKYYALFFLRFIMFCVCVCACPLSQGKLLGDSQISLMSLEVMQNSCAFTCSWVKPGTQTEKGVAGRVCLWFCWNRYPGCYWASWPTCSFFRKK